MKKFIFQFAFIFISFIPRAQQGCYSTAAQNMQKYWEYREENYVFKNNFLYYAVVCFIVFVLTLLLSKFSFIFVESRFLKLKDKFTALQSHI